MPSGILEYALYVRWLDQIWRVFKVKTKAGWEQGEEPNDLVLSLSWCRGNLVQLGGIWEGYFWSLTARRTPHGIQWEAISFPQRHFKLEKTFPSWYAIAYWHLQMYCRCGAMFTSNPWGNWGGKSQSLNQSPPTTKRHAMCSKETQKDGHFQRPPAMEMCVKKHWPWGFPSALHPQPPKCLIPRIASSRTKIWETLIIPSDSFNCHFGDVNLQLCSCGGQWRQICPWI